MASEKEYLDAKFDGLKDLLLQQDKNMKSYVDAVSANVREVRKDLADHKESPTAHSGEAVARSSTSIIGWLALAVSIVAAAAPLFAKH